MRKNKLNAALSVALVACIAMSISASGCKPETVIDEGNMVTFDFNDTKSRPYSVLADENNIVEEPAAPVREGHTFAGWYTDAENGEPITFPYTATSSTSTIYAHWELRQYAVSLDYNYENSPAPIVLSVDYGEEIDEPEALLREDGSELVFYRWETLPENGVEISFPYTVTDNVSFYARWVKGIVNIEFDYNYGEEPDKDEQPESGVVRAIQDDVFTLPTRYESVNMSRTFFEFRGWAESPDSTNVLTTRQLRDIASGSDLENGSTVTLYAIWRRAEYQIAFRNNYGGLDTSERIFYRTTIIGGNELNAPTEIPVREGYTFLGWGASQRSLTLLEFPYIPTSSGSIYACWKKDEVETNIFDAEYLSFNPDESFPGYSGSANGRGIVMVDSTGNYNASTQTFDGIPDNNGRFVSYLYKQGATLRFVINSSAAVDNVTLYATLATEVNRNLVIGPTGDNAYRFVVNGTDINYTPLSFSGLADINEGAGNYANAFRELTISTTVSLKAGENVIELITANSNASAMGGTMQAVAPMVDNIRLDTRGGAILTWSPVYDNICEWDA